MSHNNFDALSRIPMTFNSEHQPHSDAPPINHGVPTISETLNLLPREQPAAMYDGLFQSMHENYLTLPRNAYMQSTARKALGNFSSVPSEDKILPWHPVVGNFQSVPSKDFRLPPVRFLSVFDSENNSDVWELCYEITNKRDWHSKVFNEEIVNKWKDEVPPISHDNFSFAIKLLRANAQGSKHLEDCNWDKGSDMCRNCRYNLKQGILDNPQQYNLNPEDIDLNFFKDSSWDSDFSEYVECRHPRCSCTAPDSSLHNYVDYHSQGILTSELHAECKSVLAEMAANEPINWHPGSNDQVRDILHPSMYCYVKGVSKYYDGTVAEQCDEAARFQWLPSEFEVAHDATVKVASYINNLDETKHPRFVSLIERVFQSFLPSLEQVLNKNLRGRPVQVIVKVGSIILTPENNNYPGGSFHIEGMPFEHIGATCIHYVDADNITDSFLEFRKPTIINEDNIDYPQNDDVYTEHHYGITDHNDGVMNRYLGLIRCSEGASVIFPNTLQHRVKDFSLIDGAQSSLRTILAFFVIDPDHEIVSTEDVPPQQEIFTLEQAHHHRERLMYHRKYFVIELNRRVFERPYSLCEH